MARNVRKAHFYSLPAYGHVNPTLEVVRGLVEKGERIKYYTNPEFFPLIKEVGAEPIAYHDMPSARDLPVHFLQNFFLLGNEVIRLTEKVTPLLMEEAMNDRPDYVLHDSMALWGAVVGRSLSLPTIASIPTFVLGVEGQKMPLRDQLAGASMALAAPKAVWSLWSGARRIAKRYNVLAPSFAQTLCAVEDFNIVYTCEALQPAVPNQKSYAFVGPSVRSENEPLDLILSSDVTVYIALGTVNNRDRQFYKNCFEAFEDWKAQFFISVGDEKDHLGQIPHNFVVRDRFPQTKILPHAKAFITHCGMNSVHEALSMGVPLVLIPSTPEQRLVAEQVSGTGAGYYLKERVTVESLRAALSDVLEQESYHHAALRMKERLGEAGGAPRAVDEIMKFVSQQIPS